MWGRTGRAAAGTVLAALPRIGTEPPPIGTDPGAGSADATAGRGPGTARPTELRLQDRYSRATRRFAILLVGSATAMVLTVTLQSWTGWYDLLPVGFALQLGALLLVPLLVVSLIVDGVRAARLRNAGPTALPPAAPVPQDPVEAAALAARERRAHARRLAGTDPLLAAELHIGRPDLGGEYDDGGLVDLNAAPAEVIARLCRIEPELAERIITARGTSGCLAVDDVFSLADIPVGTWDPIRDRAVLLGPDG